MARIVQELPPLSDNDICPSGKHKGEKMIDVPATYLLYVYENNMVGERVMNYVKDNLEVIKDQAKKSK